MQKIIFVGGVPRSGTSLFQKILDLHSDIYGGPEFDHLPEIMKLYSNMKTGVISGRQEMYYELAQLKEAKVKFIESIIMGKIDKTKSYSIISEKTPDNILVFDHLIELFPNSNFFFIARDPRAIYNSFKNLKGRNKNKNKIGFGENILDDLNRIYLSIKAGDDFIKKNSSQCKIVYYENLVSKPLEEIKDVCNFLDVPFQTQMLETETPNDTSIMVEKKGRSNNPFITPLFDKKIQTSSINSWTTELNKVEILLFNYFFSKKNISCLSNYKFSSNKVLGLVLFNCLRVCYKLKSLMPNFLRKQLQLL